MGEGPVTSQRVKVSKITVHCQGAVLHGFQFAQDHTAFSRGLCCQPANILEASSLWSGLPHPCQHLKERTNLRTSLPTDKGQVGLLPRSPQKRADFWGLEKMPRDFARVPVAPLLPPCSVRLCEASREEKTWLSLSSVLQQEALGRPLLVAKESGFALDDSDCLGLSVKNSGYSAGKRAETGAALCWA